jgi:hypothetical protein
MGIAGNITIGAVVDATGITRGVKIARGALEGIASGASGFGAAITAGLAGAGAIGVIVKAASAASDLNEQLSAAGVIFGPAADKITTKAQEMADRFGIVKSAHLESAVAMGSLFKAMGQTDDQAADSSNTFLKLAYDLSSIRNVRVEDALGAIRSGLSGEAEPLKRFGVLMNDAAVKAKGLELGLTDASGAMSEQAKSTARAALIQEGLAYANGDLARTFGGAANQARAFSGKMQNAWADAGNSIKPLTDSALFLANTALQAVSDAAKANTAAVLGLAEAAVGTGGIVSEAVGNIGAAIAVGKTALGDWTVLWDSITVAGLEWGAATLEVLDTVAQRIEDLINGMSQFTGLTSELGSSLDGTISSMNAQAEATREAMTQKIMNDPGAMKVLDGTNALQDKLAALGRTLADVATASNAADPMKGLKTDTRAPQLAGAMDRGGAEARSAILNATRPAADPMRDVARTGKETLSEQRRGNSLLNEIAKGLKKAPATPAIVSL